MSHSKFSARLLVSIVLAVLFGVALYLRAYLPYDQIFTDGWIKFASVDAYYHMRLVDNLLHNFPHYLTFDPYTFYPNGTIVPWPPFFDWLLAGIIWLIGLGSPTQHTVDVVGVYFPAVIGALTVIPVFFIGKALFNRWVGVISAGLVAILPGEFLGRSILGFTDHHVAEVFLTAVTVLFLILALKASQRGQLSFRQIKHRQWPIVTKPLVYSLLAGISLGIYLLTWVGGLLFVFIIFVYFVVQFIIDHLKHRSTDYLCLVGAIIFFVALAMFLPISQEKLYLAPLIIAFLALLLLNGISRLMEKRGVKRIYYPVAVAVLGVTGLSVLYFVDPVLLESMLAKFGIFVRSGAGLTISEVRPLLFTSGSFSLTVAWNSFTTSLFLSLISFGVLTYHIIRRGEPDKTLLLVWSLLMLAAALGQRRFAYYFAVNAALLTGYISWRILEFAGISKLMARPVETLKRIKKKKGRLKRIRSAPSLAASRAKAALGAIAVFFLVFFPNISPAMNVAGQVQFAPDDAWYETLSWLKENTSEPFAEPNFYFELYEPPPTGEGYQYPESAYGVMAWWDYGHWISRIAHRIPISNPFQQGAAEAGRFFTAQDEASANEMMTELGARYVIIDMATTITKFSGVVIFAGGSSDEFYDFYYELKDDRLVPIRLFYPEYYQSLAIRLYNFNGEAVTPGQCTVVSYEEKVSQDGINYRQITDFLSFPSYEAATAYIAGQKSGNYRIAGTNPFVTPVPLDALVHYQLIYESSIQATVTGFGEVPMVKIFEYIE